MGWGRGRRAQDGEERRIAESTWTWNQAATTTAKMMTTTRKRRVTTWGTVEHLIKRPLPVELCQ
eukprot:5734458-Pyramimonas_sp.AAC.1